MRQIVWELHSLLEKSGEGAPFVLVGHSFGGALVRLYTTTYPADVAGLVLVDAQYDDYVRLVSGLEWNASTLASGKPIPAVKTSGPLRESDIPPGALRQIRALGEWNAQSRQRAAARQAPGRRAGDAAVGDIAGETLRREQQPVRRR